MTTDVRVIDLFLISSLLTKMFFCFKNSIKLKKDKAFPKLGYFFGASYKKSFSYYENGEQGRYKLTGNTVENDKLNTELTFSDFLLPQHSALNE